MSEAALLIAYVFIAPAVVTLGMGLTALYRRISGDKSE